MFTKPLLPDLLIIVLPLCPEINVRAFDGVIFDSNDMYFGKKRERERERERERVVFSSVKARGLTSSAVDSSIRTYWLAFGQ